MSFPNGRFGSLLSFALVSGLAQWNSAQAQDFDGDGIGDLAAGAPEESLWSFTRCGTASVRYGSGVRQNIAPVPSIWNNGPEPFARFSAALAWGDFDGDGYDDLAVGAPGASVQGVDDAGIVAIFSGSPSGLDPEPQATLSQSSPGLNATELAEPNDQFGWSLAAGDFNGDGLCDLAVGAPFEDTKFADSAGCVHVLFGAKKIGLTGQNSRTLYQGTDGLDELQESWDFFGYELVAGDFLGDGSDDLAIGTPFEDVEKVLDAGVVQVVPFLGTLPDFGRQQLWREGAQGLAGKPGTASHFGFALAAGDFDMPGLNTPDGADDLAMGAPGADPSGVDDAGVVHLLFGLPEKGLTLDQSWYLHQGMNSVWGESLQEGDAFGFALAAPQRWNGTACLAIGVPLEDDDQVSNAGVVHLLGRTPKSSWKDPDVLMSTTIRLAELQGDPVEPGHRFGFALSGYGLPRTWDHPADQAYDNGFLAIGAPFHDAYSGAPDVGSVSFGWLHEVHFWGTPKRQDHFDPTESPEANDRFGMSL